MSFLLLLRGRFAQAVWKAVSTQAKRFFQTACGAMLCVPLLFLA